MMNKLRTIAATVILSGGLTMALFTTAAFAHCDTTRGPVIREAKAALETGDVTPILKWVKKDKEAEIKTVFAKAVSVRSKGPAAKELADQYFLETLVRLHREGEGAPYTGIKDEPVEPVIRMADKSLADGSADQMITRISRHMAETVRHKFNTVLEAKRDKDRSVEAGRRFVEAYVNYTHYVEAIHAAVTSRAGHHHDEAAAEKRPTPASARGARLRSRIALLPHDRGLAPVISDNWMSLDTYFVERSGLRRASR